MDWQLNSGKSRLWANTAQLRRWLTAEGGGVPASTTFKDLGVVARAGPARRAPVAAERIRGAVGRFARIAQLPVTFRVRCQMGA
eukprot:8973943-Lingulodinium_polyedra.AAC.1